MKKFLARYYLLLSVILLGGYGQLHAHHKSEAVAAKSSQVHTGSSHAASLLSYANLINYTTQHFEKQQETIEISQNENEEEELSIHSPSFVKKCLANKHYLYSYYQSAPGLSYESRTKRLPSCIAFHSLSSRQYILFRVIRI